MYRYMVKTFREPSKQDLRENPNLTAKQGVTLKIFQSPENLYAWKPDKTKRFLESKLVEGMFINPKYDLKRTEKVAVYNSEGKVFDGKVRLPKNAVELSGELDQKKYVENLFSSLSS